MRRLLGKFLKPKSKWVFQKADLSENTTEIRNPARGWYCIYSFMAEAIPDFKNIAGNVAESKDSLVLVIINIGAYRESDIDEKGLENIRSILRFFSEHQYDMILRITYDHEGKAFEREPFFFEQVKKHINQLIPILKEFSHSIFVYQGFLVGNWGEMHTSRFLTSDKLLTMWKLFKNELEYDMFFSVRKPLQWRMLHSRDCDKRSLKDARMGLFDDAIFGSESHLGTFGVERREKAGWDELWSREDELEFENKLCTYVPNGGEALCGEQYLQQGALNETIAILKKMHITYLNRQYDKLILNTWKEWSWPQADAWQGKSVYDYIGNHLGYRFFIRDVQAVESAKISNEMDVAIQIENVGFANLYQEAELYLICEDELGHQYERSLDVDMRTWNSNAVQTIHINVRKINCRIFLYAIIKKDRRYLYFANQYDRNGRVLLGNVSKIEK